MTDSLLKDPFISKYLKVSVFLHVALVLSFSVKSTLWPSKPILVQDSIKVDLVGLPPKAVKKKNPQALPSKKAKKKTVPKKPKIPKVSLKPKVKPKKKAPKVSIKKAKKRQSQALSQLKALSALERLKNLPDPKKAEPQEETIEEQPPVAGEQIAPGTALTGLTKLKHNSYISQVSAHVRRFWFLPEWLTKADFRAKALIQFNALGELLKIEIIESSGNGEFDALIKKTLRDAEPFPAPPEAFKKIVEVDGITLGFPD